MSRELWHDMVTSLIFIIDSHLLLFQRKYKNKDYSHKLGVALKMAREAEQISIQVGECSDHIPAPLWDLGPKANHTFPTSENWFVLPDYTVSVLELHSLFFPSQIPLIP